MCNYIIILSPFSLSLSLSFLPLSFNLSLSLSLLGSLSISPFSQSSCLNLPVSIFLVCTLHTSDSFLCHYTLPWICEKHSIQFVSRKSGEQPSAVLQQHIIAGHTMIQHVSTKLQLRLLHLSSHGLHHSRMRMAHWIRENGKHLLTCVIVCATQGRFKTLHLAIHITASTRNALMLILTLTSQHRLKKLLLKAGKSAASATISHSAFFLQVLSNERNFCFCLLLIVLAYQWQHCWCSQDRAGCSRRTRILPLHEWSSEDGKQSSGGRGKAWEKMDKCYKHMMAASATRNGR